MILSAQKEFLSMNNRFSVTTYLVIFSGLILLNACGGGASTSTSTKEETTYTFQLTATLSNQCGTKQPFTEIELQRQDDNWQTLQTYSANSNGIITFTTSDEFINYTLIAKSQYDDAVEGLDIQSFYQASTATPSIYSATYDSAIDNSNCECITNNLLLTHRAIASRGESYSSLPYDSIDEVDTNTTQFNNVQACRVSGEDWPIGSFMVTGTNTSDNLIGAGNFLSDFTQAEQWSIAAIEIPEEITLTANEDIAFTASQLFANDEHFVVNVSEDDRAFLLFTNHLYSSESFYKFYSQQIISSSSTLFSESVFASKNLFISSSADDVYNTDIYDKDVNIDYTNFSELASDGSYNYSAVNNHPMSIIKLNYQVLNSQTNTYYPITWTNYGAISGVLASSVTLNNYDDFINQSSTTIERTEVNLIRSKSSSKYQDYINYFQANTNPITSTDITTDFTNNLHFYYISHALN